MRLAASWTKVTLAVAILAVSGACVTGGRSQLATPADTEQPSPSLARGIYYEEGSLVFFAVNVELARFQLDKELLPLEIAVANKGLEKLTVGPEGITLHEVGGGKAWPMASPEESVSSSLRSSFDRQLQPVSLLEVVKQRFRAFTYVPTTLAERGGNISMTRTAEMARNTWTMSQVWFPNPGGDLKGKLFEVWLEAPELDQPVFTTIRF